MGKKGEKQRDREGTILDINQTLLRLKERGIEEASETVSNMEFCLSIAQIGPLIPLDKQSMKQMALNWLILPRGNFSPLASFHLLALLF